MLKDWEITRGLPGQTARSRFAPSTIIGPATPRLALFLQPRERTKVSERRVGETQVTNLEIERQEFDGLYSTGLCWFVQCMPLHTKSSRQIGQCPRAMEEALNLGKKIFVVENRILRVKISSVISHVLHVRHKRDGARYIGDGDGIVGV